MLLLSSVVWSGYRTLSGIGFHEDVVDDEAALLHRHQGTSATTSCVVVTSTTTAIGTQEAILRFMALSGCVLLLHYYELEKIESTSLVWHERSLERSPRDKVETAKVRENDEISPPRTRFSEL